MDATLSQTLRTLQDPSQVTWSTERPAAGAEPAPEELFLSVGQRPESAPPHPRMLSWKLPQWRGGGARSTTEVVLRSASVLDALGAKLGALAPGPLGAPVALRLHEHTLDAVAASFLAVHRLVHRVWPRGAKALCDYVSDWEQGRIEEAGEYERALASIHYATLSVFRGEGGAAPAPALLELLAHALDLGEDRRALASIPEHLVPARVARRLRADEALYRAELSRARLVQLDLPLDASSDAPSRRVDAMFLSSPQDVTLLKLLARPDRAHSHYQAGFDVLVVHAPNEKQDWARHTVTLAPERPGTLGDLAATLDAVEGPKTPGGEPRPVGQRRFANQPNDYQDPWYSDGYAWPKGRSTLVAPPFAGTRLGREELWEAVFERFHPGRNIRVLEARTVFVRPYRGAASLDEAALRARGWTREALEDRGDRLLPSVARSFLGADADSDVVHLSRPREGRVAHLSRYPNGLVLAWVEVAVKAETTLLQLAHTQAHLCAGEALAQEFDGALAGLEPLLAGRWQVYGAYRLDRARSTMLDGCASIQGLFHALASGAPPTLRGLPGREAEASRRVFQEAHGDIEHWFTPQGGARLELHLEAPREPLRVDRDFALFLLTLGQRYSLLELTRRLGEAERTARRSRWQALRPLGDVRGDVMFFTNSLWYGRVSDAPELEARYAAWRALHGMDETLGAMREQTGELDSYRRERFEGMVGAMVFLFLPVTIVCGFFSGAQFQDMSLQAGVPGTTGGWVVFLIYLAVFTVLVFGAWTLGRLLSWRGR